MANGYEIKVQRVRPLSRDSIFLRCDALLRDEFPECYHHPSWFPLRDLFEGKRQAGFLREYKSDIVDLPPGFDGATDFTNRRIILSVDSHDLLEQNHGRGRFTLAHEYGHALLHSDQLGGTHHDSHGVQRLPRSQLKTYEDPEWQANTAAAELLMPWRHIDDLVRANVSAEYLARLFGVSYQAAQNRISFAQKKHREMDAGALFPSAFNCQAT